MDTSLLQKRGATAPNTELPEPKTLEAGEDGALEVAYRELAIEPPSPPVRIKLEPPVEYDGKTYSEITCDFEGLLGNDYIRAEREFRHIFKPATKNEFPFAQMNPDFHVILISYAADVPTGLIKKLPVRYFTALQTEALKICGGSVAEEKK